VLSPLRGNRIYVCSRFCDMRLGFNGLVALAANLLNADPYSGALFLFTNKRRNRMKILYFDGQSLWVLARRMEKGTFTWPVIENQDQPRIELTHQAFHLLIGGIDLKDTTRRGWYEHSMPGE
jgi:transposase